MELCPFEQCTGCSACKSACSRECISMHPDQYGFLHPIIDTDNCVNCGKCRAACPVISELLDEDLNLAFAATHHSRRILNQSSSGGAFSAIAQLCIDQGGVVYGAAFDDHFRVNHVAVNNKKDLVLLRGTKYVQSDLGNTFSDIRKYLEAGKRVLFSGTPCQTAGLNAFFGKKQEKLFLIDIICHSIPSPLAWRRYLEWVEKRLGDHPNEISFRDKKYGWESYCLSFHGGKNCFREFGRESRYIQAFQSGLISRESCENCKFKGENHISDLTLGDFWGCAVTNPKAYCEYGTSIIIVHSKKGFNLINDCKGLNIISLQDSESALNANPSYSQSLKGNQNRSAFLRETVREGFETAVSLFSEEFSDMSEQEKDSIKKYYSFVNRKMRNIKNKILNH